MTVALNTILFPDEVEDSSNPFNWVPPEVPIVNEASKREPIFLYDKETAVLAEGLEGFMESMFIESVNDLDSEEIGKHSQLLVGIEDVSLCSGILHFAAVNNRGIGFMNSPTFSPFRLLVYGMPLQLTKPGATLKEKMEYAYRDILNGVKPSQPDLELVNWLQENIYKDGSKANYTKNLIAALNSTSCNSSIIEKVSSSVETLLTYVLKRDQLGEINVNYIRDLFHGHWYDLYHTERCEKTKPLAKICLTLLESSMNKKGEVSALHYILKTYWSLYSDKDYNALQDVQAMKARMGNTNLYPTHTALALWALGNQEQAMELLTHEGPHGELDIEALHKNALTHALLGNIADAEIAMQNLKKRIPGTFKEMDGYEGRWYYQALILKAVGLENEMDPYMKRAQEEDPQVAEKSFMMGLATPRETEFPDVFRLL